MLYTERVVERFEIEGTLSQKPPRTVSPDSIILFRRYSPSGVMVARSTAPFNRVITPV
jgi:hypothetical protein